MSYIFGQSWPGIGGGLVAVYKSLLECIGNTPLVEIGKIRPPGGARILVKMESLNPGGSIKARSAASIIEEAEKQGRLKPGDTIVEASSGNQGISLAMIGAVKGYRVVVCLPETMSMERRRVLQAYGAELVLTPTGKDIKETLELCIAKVHEILETRKGAFWACQFDNPANCEAHYRSTAEEILKDLGTNVHAFVAGIGTGGTITGVGRRMKEVIPSLQVVAVEPCAAPLLKGGEMGHHCQEGIGDGIMPGIMDPEVVDRIELVSDEDALCMARNLATKEGLFCGVSTGTTVCGAVRIAAELPKDHVVVAIMADGGEKYLSTPLCQF